MSAEEESEIENIKSELIMILSDDEFNSKIKQIE